jgi:3alpha(or 20beta)-hydroxysteroid dehydrogenase
MIMSPRRVALVTGAAGGQGWAIANRLRAQGYSVAACDRRFDELVAAVDDMGDDGLIGVDLDVTSPAQWDAAIERVMDRFGSLSTLVNNAGVLHRAALTDETVADFENAWRVNCLGAFLGMRALRGLTQTAAAELAPSGIRVNAVFPGPIATSMLDDVTQERLVETSTFGRLGRPGEIADAVAFLVSEEALFITGSELVVDGGQCLQIR